MNKISLNELMTIERLLLEIDNKFKFDLTFKEALQLYNHLKEVGKITNYFFLLQDEYYKKYKDGDKLKQYHDKLAASTIDFDSNDITSFIEKVMTNYGDNDFYALVEKIRFW